MKIKKSDTLIIIPAYKEENTIGRVVARTKKLGFDVLVVNDCSRDNTVEQARNAGGVVINLPVNAGYGTALQTGYKYAWRHGYSFVAQLDGDGQHDPRYLPALLEPVYRGECDLSVGSRFLSTESYKVPLARRVGIFFFAAILNLCTGQKKTDPSSGFQAMNSRTLRLLLGDEFPRDFPDADMLLMLHRAGLLVKEVPVVMHKNVAGKSMHGGFLAPMYYIFRMTLGLMVTMLRRKPRVFKINTGRRRKRKA